MSELRTSIDIALATFKSMYKKSDFMLQWRCDVCRKNPSVYEADEKYTDDKIRVCEECYGVLK